MPDEAKDFACQVLTKLGEAHADLWTRGDLGSLVDVTRVRVLNVWTLARVSVTESRAVVDAFVPYRNERLPRQRVMTADEVDPAKFGFFKGDPDEGEESTDVEGSGRHVTCHECKKGKIACASCEGAGKGDCFFCDGSGRRACSECFGSGRVEGQRGEKNCPDCKGRGDKTCPTCVRGHTSCDDCKGTGATECKKCGGHGQLLQVLRVLATRTRHIEEVEWHHPDLEPLLSILKVFNIKEPSAAKASLDDLDDEEILDLAEENGIELPEGVREHPDLVERLAKSTRTLLASRMTVEALEEDLDDLEPSEPVTAMVESATRLHRMGLPLPPLRRDLRVLRREHLGIPADLAAATCAAEGPVGGARGGEIPFDCGGSAVMGHVFAGAPRGVPATGLLDVTDGRVAREVGRLLHDFVPKADCGKVVRDHIVLVGRSWVAADYTLEGKAFTLFLGRRGIYAPTGSPIADEPTRLVGEARKLAETGQGTQVAELLRRAFSDSPALRPDPGALGAFVTSIPKLAMPRREKLALLAVIADDLSESELGNVLFDFDSGAVTPALVVAARWEINNPLKLIASGLVAAAGAIRSVIQRSATGIGILGRGRRGAVDGAPPMPSGNPIRKPVASRLRFFATRLGLLILVECVVVVGLFAFALIRTPSRSGVELEQAVPAASAVTVAAATRSAGAWSTSSAVAFPEGRPPAPIAALLAELARADDEAGSSMSAAELRALLDDPRAADVYRPELMKVVTPESKKLQSQEHRSFLGIFMKEAKLAAGAGFLGQHADELEQARAKFGVEPQDITSVLMWESDLGKATGTYRVVNVYLGQLLFMDVALADCERITPLPPGLGRDAHLKRLANKKKRATEYLAALLRACKAKHVDPLEVRGSWAGAIGFPQFMPTSYRFAVDGDGDGAIDLYSFPDAIASIASYLSQHGYAVSRAGAIHEYNPEDEYVRGVMRYADAIASRGAGMSGGTGAGQ